MPPQSETDRPRSATRRASVLVGGIAVVAACGWFWQTGRAVPTRPRDANTATHSETDFMPKIQKTDAEWQAQLTPEQYEVTRRKGTERAFTGEYWNNKQQGRYKCVCCGAELFTSDTKYDSGCGWPSFYASDKPENLHTEEDRSHGMTRTEVMCKQCGAHLGHIFDDGPQPTGVRYCMNSASLDFEKKDGTEKDQKAKQEETK